MSGGTASAHLRRLVLRTLMPGFAGTAVPDWLDAHLRDGLGSVCLYASNVESRDQLRSLCADLRSRSARVVLAVDEEGGDVTRLHYRTGSPYVGNAVLGRLDDLAVTEREAARIAADLRAVGIDLDLAPVVDVNSSDDNPVIGTRSFGPDAELVARHTGAWTRGLQTRGIAACAKHFPGHGDTTTDSHLTLPVVDAKADVVRDRELRPFRAAVEAGTACVMTAAIVVPSVDPDNAGTFSATLLRDVLRGELGFEGVVVTDALDMAGASAETGIPEAAVRALAAGCDLLCLGSDTDPALVEQIVAAVLAAVDAGRLAEERLRDAAARVDALADAWVIGGPAPAAPEEALQIDAAAAFRIAEHAREWLGRTGYAAVVQVETSSNLAVGQVPWGPASLAATVSEADAAEAGRIAVVGRALGPAHPAWDVAARLTAAGKDVVVVECGWPRPGVEPGIVTWGGSPEVARALLDLIGHGGST